MKKLSTYSNYIFGFVLLLLISTTGYLVWENTPKDKELISENLEIKDPSQLKGKEKYAYYKALYEKYRGWTKQELKKLPKKDRPDLAALLNFLRTADPNTGDIPENAPIKANELTDLRLNALSQNQRAIAGVNWVERGPNDVGGRTRALMYDPNDGTGRKVWAGGVGGGLWYTNDITVASPTWVAVDNFWENIAISSIAYDPTNTQNMYVSTGEGFFGGGMQRGAGIWKTSDGGTTWARLANTSPTVTDDFQYVQKIVVTSAGTLLAACRTDGFNSTDANSGGIFRSTDEGANWTKVTLPETSTRAADLEVASDGTIYGTTSLFGAVVGSIYKSTSASDGVAWTEVTPAGISANTRRIEISSAPSNSNILYAVAHDASTNNIAFFKKSINAGTSWTDVTIPLYRNQGGCLTDGTHFTRGQAWYDLILQVNPTNSDHVVVGGIDVHRTTNGGTSWTSISYWTGACGPYVHADIHAFAYKPGSSDEMLVGSDGGISYSANIRAATPNFADRNTGYNVTQFYAVAMNPNNGSNYLLAGAQDNGTRKLTSAGVGGSTQPTGGDGAFCFIDQDNPNIQISSYVFNSFYKSTNGGTSFSNLGTQDQGTGDFINPADYHDALDLLYSSSQGNRDVARWTVPGGTRSNFNVTGGMTGNVTHLKASPFTAASTTLYVGTDAGEVVRVANANTAGANKAGTVLSNATMQAQGSVSSIEFGTSENQMVVTYSNYGVQSVWYTANGGTSWTSKDTAHGLPDMPVRWAMFNPNNTNEVLIATETGIWSTDDITAGAAADFWEVSSTGLANTRCDMLQIRSSDNLVAVATHGRGVFTTNVFSPAAADFAVSQDIVYMNKNVIFTDASAGATSWDWNFGTGASTATAATVGPHTVSYTTPGIKTITLAINGGGGVLTVTKTITVLPDRPVPYAITDGGNFDVNPLDFAADNIGGATMWERGNSATAGKNGTASGANAWVTGLTGNYLDNSHSNLYAPNFNFSAAGTYNLSFQTKHVYETGYDGMIVEYSTDRGTSWTKLGTATTTAAWYNSVIAVGPDPTVFGPQGTPFMSATNANYFTKSLDVSSLAGTLDVAFRIVFKSDITINFAGGAVDNFLITFVPSAIPEINVQGNGNNIVSGTGTTSLTNDTNFGDVAECGTNSLAKTYTIQNTGGAALTVSNITVTGANAADFTLSGLPAFPATVAATTGTQTFTVTFNPSAIGNRVALVTITNDDADENPYTFAINGNGTADNVPPVVPTLADVTAECSVTPTAPTTTDNCAGTVTGTTGTVFPITTQGTTVVTWTFNDGNGNSVTADQNVILDDVTAPVVPTLVDVTAECSSTPTAPTTTDNCVGTITGTTGTVFPITAQGTTVVTWTFNDGNGNSVTADQNVILDDVTAPVVPTLADVTAECSSTPTAPTTTDNCAGTVTGTTGTVFPITAQGTTVVTWTFDDGNGNTSTADQNVILDDVTAPVVPTLADVTAECSVTPTAPTTTDNCAGTVTGTTGTVFPITAQGTTVVTWTFDDGNGNTSTADQNVILDDVTNPTVTAPINVTVNTDTGLCTASGVALGTPTGSDNCGTPTFTNDAPATFPIGNTTVTWTADDGNGNTQTATQTVTVNSTREIDVQGNAVSIVDGDVTPNVSDDTDFGNTATSRTITYTIENTGTETLTITSIVSSGTNATDFVVSSIPATVAAGGSATFDVTFTPSGTGTRTATITINNNDCDEAAYDFAVEGSNTSGGDVLLVRTGIFYPTIQQAVDAAIANDTIKPTGNRNYPENVIVDKNLTFTSDFTDYKNVNINQILVENGNKLTITGDMSIVEVLHLESTGEMEVTGSTTDFALLSSATQTALVINDSPTNTVVGTVIMERYLPAVSDLGGTDGRGYHLFSSPFSDATVSQFGDDMSLVLTTAYNTAPEPAFVRPFPTFFQYEESNAGATSSAYFNPFISNYKVPTTANLTVTRGYQANISTGVTVDLNGTLNNGSQSISVTNSGGGFSQEGYNLVGNPYPSPIDWELVLLASTGVEDAVYIDIPVNQYQGIFAEYVNGVSNNGGKKEIASMQGFFVRTLGGGTVNMNNGVRLGTDTRFYKTTETQNVKEGLIRVALKKGTSLDETTIYFESGATPNFDGKYDAAKLHKMNSASPTLYSYNENTETAETEYFAINGLGRFDSDQSLPLAMNILTDGEYEITLRSMKYFHSKHELYLYDSLTDSLHNLKAEGDYKFEATKGNEVKRFVLLFKTEASQDFFENEKLMVYPNPTPNRFSYSLRTNKEGNYTIRLFDATGRIIFEAEQSKEGAFLEGTIDLEKQASGLYLLQVSDSEKTTTVRIVKE
ncbi:choice-of-anchor D domain-containing protein [Bernardetia sp. MNP-M8]|uniref:choice-of-anchor D domain-containing protein n=1 Tax=Bernardetia sp. MNP-M8 TaxID=3127470 RepID=UPI0030CCEDEE